jgi:hypothetical protein
LALDILGVDKKDIVIKGRKELDEEYKDTNFYI